MNALLLLGTPGDHIEVIIGILLGFFLVLWAIGFMIDLIKRKPWQHRGVPAEHGVAVSDEGNASDENRISSTDPPRLVDRLTLLFTNTHLWFLKLSTARA